MAASETAPAHDAARAVPAARAPLGRGATAALLAALVLVVGGLVAYVNTRITSIILDETLFKQSAVRYTSGLPHTLLHDPDARATSRLYSLVVSPLFAAFHGDVAVRGARAFNGLAFASTAVPAYLLARFALSRRAALVAAAAAITVPWLTLSTAMFSEGLAYPLATWALLAIAWSWRRPGALTDVLVLAAIALATVTRVQFVALFLVYAIVIVWRLATVDRLTGWRSLPAALRTFPVTCALVALAVLALLLRKAGLVVVGPSINGVLGHSYASTTTARATVPSDVGLAFGVQILLFALGTGILPLIVALAWLPGALRARLTRVGPGVIAVLLVAATVGIWSLVMYSQGGPLGPVTEERYYFYIAPLVWIAALAAAGAPWVTPRRLLGWGAALTLLALLIALPQGLSAESSFFAPASSGWTWITGRISVHVGDLTGVAGLGRLDLMGAIVLGLVGAAAFAVHRAGLRALAWVLGAGLGLQLVLTAIGFAALTGRIEGWPGRTGGPGFATLGFVDRATDDRQVTWIHNQPYDGAWDTVQRTALFYNDTIRRTAAVPALGLTPVDFPMASLPQSPLTITADGRVLGIPTPTVVQTLQSPFLQIAGRLVAASPALRLGVFDVGPAPRAAWYATGLDPYARLAPGAAMRWRLFAPGATVTVQPDAPARVRVRTGGRSQTVTAPAGAPTTITLGPCTGGRAVTGTLTADAPLAVRAVAAAPGRCGP